MLSLIGIYIRELTADRILWDKNEAFICFVCVVVHYQWNAFPFSVWASGLRLYYVLLAVPRPFVRLLVSWIDFQIDSKFSNVISTLQLLSNKNSTQQLLSINCCNQLINNSNILRPLAPCSANNVELICLRTPPKSPASECLEIKLLLIFLWIVQSF